MAAEGRGEVEDMKRVGAERPEAGAQAVGAENPLEVRVNPTEGLVAVIRAGSIETHTETQASHHINFLTHPLPGQITSPDRWRRKILTFKKALNAQAPTTGCQLRDTVTLNGKRVAWMKSMKTARTDTADSTLQAHMGTVEEQNPWITHLHKPEEEEEQEVGVGAAKPAHPGSQWTIRRKTPPKNWQRACGGTIAQKQIANAAIRTAALVKMFRFVRVARCTVMTACFASKLESPCSTLPAIGTATVLINHRFKA